MEKNQKVLPKQSILLRPDKKSSQKNFFYVRIPSIFNVYLLTIDNLNIKDIDFELLRGKTYRLTLVNNTNKALFH